MEPESYTITCHLSLAWNILIKQIFLPSFVNRDSSVGVATTWSNETSWQNFLLEKKTFISSLNLPDTPSLLINAHWPFSSGMTEPGSKTDCLLYFSLVLRMNGVSFHIISWNAQAKLHFFLSCRLLRSRMLLVFLITNRYFEKCYKFFSMIPQNSGFFIKFLPAYIIWLHTNQNRDCKMRLPEINIVVYKICYVCGIYTQYRKYLYHIAQKTSVVDEQAWRVT